MICQFMNDFQIILRPYIYHRLQKTAWSSDANEYNDLTTGTNAK